MSIGKSPYMIRPSSTANSKRFIAGDPMKPATNALAGRLKQSFGEAHCCRIPSLRMAMRSAIVIASTWSWVTYIVVTPRRCWICLIWDLVCTRSLASRFDNGSSIRNTDGWRTIARPIATR